MTPPDLIDRLAQHKTLGSAPREELEWLAEHGVLRQLQKDEVLSVKGALIEGLYVVLSGRLALFVDRGAGPNKVIEWREGDVAGLLPYSRLMSPPGNSIAQEALEILSVHRDHLRAMTRECYTITSMLVHTMVDRARLFTSSDLHNEKMISLGKLSAGLAHELNNPASAIERSASTLRGRIEESEAATRALAAARLTDTQAEAVNDLRMQCLNSRTADVRSPLEQSDREQAIADWLDDHQLDSSRADVLSDTPLTLESLDQLSQVMEGPLLNAALEWAASGCAVRSLAAEIQEAAMRISGLVTAIKGFTRMDQAIVAEPVDLAQSLGNTVAVLKAKAREKSIAVTVEVEHGLPRVRGFAGELNQIWGNLIDNALDAAPREGRVEVVAGREHKGIAVRVIDNGAVVSPEVRDRIFDPFFTTKPMGQGTGLGLDIVRRLVGHNDGTIVLESRPGRTEFRVTLPTAESDAPGIAP